MLQQANALLRLSSNAAMIGGSAVAGILVAVLGPGWGLAVDATTYSLAAVCLSRIRLPRADRIRGGSVIVELREGWGEFRSRTWIWVIVVDFAFVNLAVSGGFNTLGPVVADGPSGRSGWGFVLAAQTAGMVLGGQQYVARCLWARFVQVGVLSLWPRSPSGLSGLSVRSSGGVASCGGASAVAPSGCSPVALSWVVETKSPGSSSTTALPSTATSPIATRASTTAATFAGVETRRRGRFGAAG